jgi:putative phosphoserine phosphatase / 1-acylglycerol-3-phosphate O-acyltransferase
MDLFYSGLYLRIYSQKCEKFSISDLKNIYLGIFIGNNAMNSGYRLQKINEILKNREFQKKLARAAVHKQISQVQANIEAEKYLEELFCEHETATSIGFVEIFQFLIGLGFDKKIDLDLSELKSLAKIMRQHPVAFIITHKSYIDLIVLSIVLARHGMPIPFMFAGINLDMPIVGSLVRKNGVIYIRRQFKDNFIYKISLRFFISWLLKKRSHFMWAIEGTRSRTGKLVWPQMGILKYIAEAAEDANTEVKYVPVSIVYDLIPDVEDMTVEGRGKKKKPESLKWMLDYISKMSYSQLGKISLRIGEPVDTAQMQESSSMVAYQGVGSEENEISQLAFRLMHKINKITPVTTISLICTALLSKFSLTKKGLESNVSNLMQIIENNTADTLVDRGMALTESVQRAVHLLLNAQIIKQQGDGLHTKYTINREKYLEATYYANMSVHHFFHRAFIELALMKVAYLKGMERQHSFWKEIMKLRDFFKFEFFYDTRYKFTDNIEGEMKFIRNFNWQNDLKSNADLLEILDRQEILVAPVILNNYLEAYKVVAEGLLIWDPEIEFNENTFMEYCLFLGEEMHWLGQIKRVEAVSMPFLQNGIRLAKNMRVWPVEQVFDKEKLDSFNNDLIDFIDRINKLQEITLIHRINRDYYVPVEREIIPGSPIEKITNPILEGEKGPDIAAFFDLDRTLISGFSAGNFAKSRILSGKITSKEVISQFAGAISYAQNTKNFAKMAAISAQGVEGVDEQVFIDLGEEVYKNSLADTIYPEARALVAAHIAAGHTVCIVSAATSYQVNPIARDLGMNIVECTRLEVVDGKFTGKIIEPACWGEAKAVAGRKLAEELNLNLRKSYFYTDSIEDLPLLELVGNPRPVNPDIKLSALAFKNDWTVKRFGNHHNSTIEKGIRTGLSLSVVLPAVLQGITSGAKNLSISDGVESMMRAIGDLGTSVAGIALSVKGEENLWTHRPAVFILNHQSNVDMLIAIRLVRRNARGVAKMELKKLPILGQILEAAGTIFIDRNDREQAIEAMKPAVDSLRTGTSLVIFPEGTRSYDYSLGKFKKGAFHIAMQAEVPIVPIILKNAHDAMPRGTNLLNPTLVEVVVLPPVLTHDWTTENMESKINEIREAYLEELNKKPE